MSFSPVSGHVLPAVRSSSTPIERLTARRRPRAQPAKDRLPWPVVLFQIGLVIPWIIPLGPLNLSVYRIILLVLFLPCLATWASGKAGRIRATDIGLLFYCGWAAASLVRAHGAAAAIEPSGILFVETIGPYLLARCYIRDAGSFEAAVVLMARIVVLLLPFAIYEWITGGKPLLTWLSVVFPTVDITTMQPRLGFWRVQGPLQHSISFGTFCGSLFALTLLISKKGRNITSRAPLAAAVAFTAFLSMSSAPIAGLVVQGALIAWNQILKQYRARWRLLWILGLAAFLVVALGSNQTVIAFYISYFTFDKETGWFRILIWEYGSASVYNNPLFGIGFAEWVRPKWMPPSIDNFWLVIAVRHGMPAVALMLGSYLWIVLSVSFKKVSDEEIRSIRLAYLICMATFFFVGTTSHFWAAPYAWFMFLLGSGAWLLDLKPPETTSANESVRPVRRLPSSRQVGAYASHPVCDAERGRLEHSRGIS